MKKKLTNDRHFRLSVMSGFLTMSILVTSKESMSMEVNREVFAKQHSAVQFQVKGTVTDATGMLLPGASVKEKGTNNGTTTNGNGEFSLQVVDEKAVLVVSFIGYQTREIELKGQSTVTIQLSEDSQALEEVVVVGYGVQKRSAISGSVSEIAQKEIARNPTPNLSNALVGQTAGIIAKQTSGEPGRDGSGIFIRGIGTTGDASPIFVIDGIVRSERDFSQLNPSEIESFAVLKDAASAAVFGVRGGNGVILVTTKRGKSGKMQINLSSNYGIQQRTRDPEFLGSYEYAMLFNEARVNEGRTPIYSDADLQKYRDGSSPDTHPDSYWLSVLNKTSSVQNHSISAFGGTDKVQYSTVFGGLSQNGLLDSDNFRRFNFRSNIDAAVTNSTKLAFDVSGRSETINSIGSPEVFRWLTSARPNLAPIQWSNGTYSSGPAYLTLPENGYRREGNQVFQGRLQLEQKLPVKGLTLKGIAAYGNSINTRKNYTYVQTPFYTRRSDGTFQESASGAEAGSFLNQSNYDFRSLTLESHLNYAATFGKSTVSGLILYTQTEDTWTFLGANRDQFTLNIDELNFGGAANRNNSGYSGSSGRQGVVGRANWTYDDKYILEGSFRTDGSEQFAPNQRWGFFPSGSVGYVISKEPFLANSSIIDFMKIRASYGILGNDRIGGSRFLYLQTFNIGSGYYPNAVFGDGNVQPTILEGSLANPNVTWETVKKLDIGLDMTLFSGLFSITMDYFLDKRSDILGRRNLSVPSLLGVGLPVENFAKVDNQGFEFSIDHRGKIGSEVRYTMNANFTYARNKVVFIDEPATTNPNILRTGRPLGTTFGYRALGLYSSQEAVNSSAHLPGQGPGDIQYEDINGDGKINDQDRVAIGPSNTPEIIMGYRAGFQYRNFELTALFQGATRVFQYYSGEAAWPFFLGTSGAYKQNLDRWTPDNLNASEPRVLIDAANNQVASSFWLRDASYVRLKNLEVAYNLALSKIKSSSSGNVRVYANANNVFTWSKIRNYDPENADSRGWGYPQFRIWNFGVNLSF